MNQNDGESCPGSEECSETRGMPLNKYLRHGDAETERRGEEEICKGCRFYPTKPEAIPDDLQPHVSTALNLSELYRSGARFTYPDGLAAVEWASLTGLNRGRERAEARQRERDRKEAKRKDARNRRNAAGQAF